VKRFQLGATKAEPFARLNMKETRRLSRPGHSSSIVVPVRKSLLEIIRRTLSGIVRLPFLGGFPLPGLAVGLAAGCPKPLKDSIRQKGIRCLALKQRPAGPGLKPVLGLSSTSWRCTPPPGLALPGKMRVPAILPLCCANALPISRDAIWQNVPPPWGAPVTDLVPKRWDAP